jgi:FGFR1 oncogene partner
LALKSMAGEEKEDELRDLVAQTLESQGVLGKIRAQLRASVFLALEEQESKTGRPLVNEKLTNFMKTKDGMCMSL